MWGWAFVLFNNYPLQLKLEGVIKVDVQVNDLCISI